MSTKIYDFAKSDKLDNGIPNLDRARETVAAEMIVLRE